jgi:hypothetical protein
MNSSSATAEQTRIMDLGEHATLRARANDFKALLGDASNAEFESVLCIAVACGRADMLPDLLSLRPVRLVNPANLLRVELRQRRVSLSMLEALLRLELMPAHRDGVGMLASFVRESDVERPDVLQFLHDRAQFSLWQSAPASNGAGLGREAEPEPSVLLATIEKKHSQSLRFVLSIFSKLASPRAEESQALRFALRSGDFDLFLTLLRTGLSPNAVARPLITEALRQTGRGEPFFDQRFVEELLKHGATVPSNSVVVALERELPSSAICLLLQNGADPDANDALVHACRKSRIDVAVQLVDRGAQLHSDSSIPISSLSDATHLLLLALGVDHVDLRRPECRNQLLVAERQVGLARFQLVRQDVLRIAVALQELELPALVTHEICVYAFGDAPMHLLWRAITTVKHFRR